MKVSGKGSYAQWNGLPNRLRATWQEPPASAGLPVARFAGDTLSQVITCPNCEKKLALKDELLGRAIICPQCKGRFVAPADGPGGNGDPSATASGETAPSGGSDMAFFDNLTSATGPAAAKVTAKTSNPRRAAGKAAAPAAARSAASRTKKKNDQMMLVWVGGGVAAVVVFVIVLAVIMSSGGGGGGTKKNENVHFGLGESIRRQLFKELILAVDTYGISKECKEEWFRLADKYKLERTHLQDLLDEGFSGKDWEQPAPAARDESNPRRPHRMDRPASPRRRPDLGNVAPRHRRPIRQPRDDAPRPRSRKLLSQRKFG